MKENLDRNIIIRSIGESEATKKIYLDLQEIGSQSNINIFFERGEIGSKRPDGLGAKEIAEVITHAVTIELIVGPIIKAGLEILIDKIIKYVKAKYDPKDKSGQSVAITFLLKKNNDSKIPKVLKNPADVVAYIHKLKEEIKKPE